MIFHQMSHDIILAIGCFYIGPVINSNANTAIGESITGPLKKKKRILNDLNSF